MFNCEFACNRVAAATLACLTLLAAPAVRADDVDRPALVDGVKSIAAPGVPGPLSVAGPHAFVVVAGRSGKNALAPVVAAGRLGRGRVVAFGHTGYLDAATLAVADTGRLVENAVRWTAKRPGGAPGSIRVATIRQRGLCDYLAKQGFKAEDLAVKDVPGRLGLFDVVALNAGELSKAETADAVSALLDDGKGLVISSLGWGWLQLSPGKSLLSDHPGNRLLAKAGIAWTDGTLERTAKDGYTVDAALSPLLHAGRALDALVESHRDPQKLASTDLAQASLSVSLAVRAFPAEQNIVLTRVHALAAELGGDVVPRPKRPLKLAMGLERAILTAELVEAKQAAPEKVQANPAAAVFPGAVPQDAPRVSRSVTVDTSIPAWHSTGLYAPPGALIEASLPAEAAGKGLFLRIGSHSDGLWNLDTWRRCPEICSRTPLAAAHTPAASAFGGLVYVEVPNRCPLGTIKLEIAGAVEAPLFVLGVTKLTDWQKQIRQRPGPWAELASDRVIVTVPSHEIRALDDPEAVLKVWNQVLDACADLACRPRRRDRPERYVADEQISAGYMHSGYPIMTHLDAAAAMVSRDKLLAGQWGLFHEMGHNHQSGDWTFEGTGEVTVNLFSLYVCEQVCRLNHPGHPAVQLGEARDRAYRKYAATGPDFEKWKSDPFLALTMYVQLREAFGWEAYQKVFTEYRELPAADRPHNDQQKRDQWLVRFSRTVKKNLGPFFTAWGIPTSEAARQSIADLPAWMPQGFPPAKSK